MDIVTIQRRRNLKKKTDYYIYNWIVSIRIYKKWIRNTSHNNFIHAIIIL